MRNPTPSTWLCALLALSGAPAAQTSQPAGGTSLPGSQAVALPERAWAAYRSYYEVFARFRDREQPQRYPSLRLRLRVWPTKAGLPLDGLTLQLASASVDQTVEVDPLSGADLPLSKRAYDEDGVLRLNGAKGDYTFSAQYSVQIRPDGIYAPQWLRSACEQGLAVKKTFALSHRLAVIGKSCTGVTFVFRAPGNDADVAFKDAAGIARPLASRSRAFHGNDAAHRLVIVPYRFRDWPQQGQLVTRGRMDLIDFIIE